MKNMKEALIKVGDKELSLGHSLTIRVALCSFYTSLKTEGLGEDEHGKHMTELYLINIKEILELIGKNIEAQNGMAKN